MDNRAGTEDAAARVQQKLQRLQQQFRAGLAGRAQQMRAAASIPDLLGAVHRLVGAAGSYGEEALAAQARHALNLLQGASGPAVPAAAAQAVARLCADCEALAGQAAADKA
ncbi:MAG: hypothetical protein QE285_04025 [Aquabacterium sp.]|nr:hypothetical protein [Aquabacterium sp.]